MATDSMLRLMQAAVRFQLKMSPRQLYDTAIAGKFGPVEYRGTRLFVSEAGVAEYARGLDLAGAGAAPQAQAS